MAPRLFDSVIRLLFVIYVLYCIVLKTQLVASSLQKVRQKPRGTASKRACKNRVTEFLSNPSK